MRITLLWWTGAALWAFVANPARTLAQRATTGTDAASWAVRRAQRRRWNPRTRTAALCTAAEPSTTEV